MTREIVRAWAARCEAERILPQDREAAIAEVAGWCELLAAGDHAELERLVALHGRAHGYDGRPASSLAGRMLALEASAPSAQAPALRQMLRVALDAYAIGLAEAKDARHHRAIRDMTPLFRVSGQRLVLMLIGPLLPELIDAAMARLLNERVASGADTAIIDLLGAGPPDERFCRTVAGLLRDPAATKLSLVLTGADPDALRGELASAGADLSRVRFEPRLSDVLDP